jgi:ergothioneine biosynthesis protein EgtB
MSGPVLAGAAVRERLEAAWDRSDTLFGTIDESALYERPIRLRQPFLFYLGHLPAFAWNHLGLRELGLPAFHAAFDDLFARGIDPPDTSEGPPEAEAWPGVDEVRVYRDIVRSGLRPFLDEPRLETTALMVLEHEQMHHETLLYMILRLDHAKKRPPRAALTRVPLGPDRRVPKGVVRLPPGAALLGAAPGSLAFGWDNEFPGHEIEVGAFSIDVTPVRNRDFLTFAESGAYSDRRLWSDEAWQWLQREGRRRPSFWQEDGRGLAVRNAFGDVPIEQAWDWPVFVTWAEASAYARQHGRRLATEAEYDRAAYGSPDGGARDFPWGDAPPGSRHGNFGLRDFTPHPVGAHPAGASAFGILDLVGNGWEWTSTPFAPFFGFKPQPGYEGYSADFFDSRHFVLKGASWATADGLVRRSFRNWFQPHYPHVFGQFRLVSD